MVHGKSEKSGKARFWAEHIDNGLLCQCRFYIGLRGEAAQASVDQSLLSRLSYIRPRYRRRPFFLFSSLKYPIKRKRSWLKVTFSERFQIHELIVTAF
jgi:hypothetical protein